MDFVWLVDIVKEKCKGGLMFLKMELASITMFPLGIHVSASFVFFFVVFNFTEPLSLLSF